MGKREVRCPSCSQNAHDETVLGREKSASRRGWGSEGENVARSQGQPWPLPLRKRASLGKEKTSEREGDPPDRFSKSTMSLRRLGEY